MERRKDNKGRVLKEGESQRKDGLYQYRWTDKFGKRHTMYANDLKALRDKKKQTLESDVEQADVIITMYELIKRYETIHKKSLKETSAYTRGQYLRKIKNDPFGEKNISSISTLDAKEWFLSLNENGMSQCAIGNMKNIISPAFQMAVDENMISYNPFSFSLNKLIKPTKKKKILLSEEQYKKLIDFSKTSKVYKKYTDMLIILHETGVRVGELCGITIDDVDLKNNCLNITHQISYVPGIGTFVQEPKSESGKRKIPLTDSARESFERLICQREALNDPGPEMDGYTSFLFLKRGTLSPKDIDSVKSIIESMIGAYHRETGDTLPKTTPHTFRHMFCTRLISAGMNVKSVQYLMGHANIRMTLDVYAEYNLPVTVDDFLRIANG